MTITFNSRHGGYWAGALYSLGKAHVLMCSGSLKPSMVPTWVPLIYLMTHAMAVFP